MSDQILSACKQSAMGLRPDGAKCLCWARGGPAPARQGRLAWEWACLGLGPLRWGTGAAGRGVLGLCATPGRDHREVDAFGELAFRSPPSLAAAGASWGAGPGGRARRARGWGTGLGRRGGRGLARRGAWRAVRRARRGAWRAVRRAAGTGGMLVGARAWRREPAAGGRALGGGGRPLGVAGGRAGGGLRRCAGHWARWLGLVLGRGERGGMQLGWLGGEAVSHPTMLFCLCERAPTCLPAYHSGFGSQSQSQSPSQSFSSPPCLCLGL